MYRPVPDTLKHFFVIRNVSDLPAQLSIKGTSCTCADIEIVDELLAAGTKTNCKIEWDVPNALGKHTFFAVVGSGETDKFSLRCQIELRDYLALNKQEVIFKEIKPQETLCHQVVVQAPPGEVLPKNIGLDYTSGIQKEFQVKIKELTDAKMFIDVFVTGHDGFGKKDYEFVINTGISDQPQIHVPVHAHHLDDFQVIPSVVCFTKEMYNNTKSAFVKIISNSNNPVIIDHVTVDDPTSINIEVVSHNKNESMLSFTPIRSGGEKNSRNGIAKVYLKELSRVIEIRYMLL